MTLTADVVGDLHRADGALADLDPDSDVGFFSMSPASAEQVTAQIRTMLDRGWEYVALAYKGRAFVALGYPTWDDYVDARFGDFRIAVPREHRAEAVAMLAGVRMSVRAIAKLLGVGVGTVHRELIKQQSGVPGGTPDDENDCAATLGRDGKNYPRRRTPVDASCSTCGDRHPAGTEECPWDRYARGIGPLPAGGGEPRGPTVETDCSDASSPDPEPDADAPGIPSPADDQSPDPPTEHESVIDIALRAVDKLRWIVEQNALLPSYVNDLERAIGSDVVIDQSESLSRQMLELAESVRLGMTVWSAIAHRLGQLTNHRQAN